MQHNGISVSVKFNLLVLNSSICVSEGMFRFTVLSDTHNVCVKFKVDSTNLIGNELFYDCVWYENNLDSLDVRLEYQLKSENEVYISSGNYDMYLPPCTLYGMYYFNWWYLRNFIIFYLLI